MEVCPNCGKITATLRDYTGWCKECTMDIGCSRCGKPFSQSNIRSMCSPCRAHVWLEQNIDRIEEYERSGHSINRAIELVRQNNKRRCHNCGRTINIGNFCSTNIECRRAAKRYLRHVNKGLPIEVALREAVCRR